jgi:DNA primase
MGFADNQDRDRVLAASDIIDIVGQHVALRPAGREHKGLCPFHEDRNPSMFVSPQKQIFKCFVCGAGGSVFDFVMRYHKMTFPEALRFLAQRSGIELQPPRKKGPRGQGVEGPSDSNEKERIAQASELAVSFFAAMLRHEQHGAEGRAYLEKRGITPEMIERFQVGVAPDKWDGLATMIASKRWDHGGFELARLVQPRKSGEGHFDLLRRRLVFPICDALGRPVAFGGRRLHDEDEPKYLNSPEHALFHKSGTLYGLHLAKQEIIRTKTAVLVEGYTDVIACHQHGASNVVAALGTALTPDHARVLKRFCEQVVLVMDGDEAGQKAADRALEVFLTADLDVSLAVIPGGQDPDELLKTEGRNGWQRVLDGASDAMRFYYVQVASKLADIGTVTGRQHAVEQTVRRLVEAGLLSTSPVRQGMILNQLEAITQVSDAALLALAKDLRKQHAQRLQSRVSPVSHNARGDKENAPTSEGVVSVASALPRFTLAAVEKAERRLLGCLLRDNDLFHGFLSDGSSVAESLTPADLSLSHRPLYQRLFDALCDDRSVTLAGLLAELGEQGNAPLARLVHDVDTETDTALAELDNASSPPSQPLLEIFETALGRLRQQHMHDRLKQDQQQLTTRPADDSARQDPNDPQRLAMLNTLRQTPNPLRIARRTAMK